MSFFQTLTKVEKQGDRRKAITLIKRELRKRPRDPWLLDALAMHYYELYEYRQALQIARSGFRRYPKSSLLLWDVACCLDMLDREREAIVLWKRCMRRKPERLKPDGADADSQWGYELVNDARYRVGVAYLRIGKRAIARKYLLQHLQGRKGGTKSLYHLSRARKFLRETKG